MTDLIDWDVENNDKGYWEIVVLYLRTVFCKEGYLKF